MTQQNNPAPALKEEPRWTPAQQQAISCRGGTVLVSAAAGSGKTAVLVQRVIEILTDREHPVDANRILVVTFSNAAAEQMKQRIQARLSELIAQNPADTYLMRQRTLLSAAHISTVHSFCLDLVRANFQLLDIPADFRLGSESEIAMLEEDIAQETIEQNYEENDGRFSDLVELVSSGRDDSGLMKTLHRLYDFVRSHPFYHRWLDEKLLMYDDTIPVGETVWGKVILNYAMDAARFAQAQLRRALEEMQGDAAMEKAYRSAFESDLAQVERLTVQLSYGRWDDICEMLASLSFQRLGVLRNYGDDQKKELVQRLRKSAQEILTELGERLFCAREADFLEDIRFLRPRIETLFELVLDYDRRLMNAKRQRSLLDFSDLEHFAVQLLRLSPSRVERYFTCPFAYFCSGGLNLQPRRKVEISPLQSGTMIHFVLERMVSAHRGKGLGELSWEQMQQEVEALLHEYLAERVSRTETLSKRFHYLFERLSITLTRLLRQLAQEFAQSQFEPIRFELPIRQGGEVAPLELCLADGTQVSVEGTVDRVDLMEQDGRRYVRVVDYKSGSKTFRLDDVYYGLNLQMLVYLFAIWKNGKGPLENCLPAGVLYLPAKDHIIQAARQTTDEQIEKEHQKKYRMNGLVLEDPVCVAGMEEKVSGVFIPVRTKNDGSFDARSSLATLEQMGSIQRHIERVLSEMASGLQQGGIAAEPADGLGYEPCKYCDYQPICQHHPEDPHRTLQEIGRSRFFDLLHKEEGGTDDDTAE
uniref:UvrD-like helicase ATP-binding domain-containing protein n=1 Tax=uncultured prokaryote TaxID=198431 RepID=A0A0H5PVZ7_9ZZZZ|nr:hypothetical protein [uncultured prokaryote]